MPLKPGPQNLEANFHELRHGPQFARTARNHGTDTARSQMTAIALKEAHKHRAKGGRASAEAALPTDHHLGMRVPKGGADCAKCRFLASPTTCGNAAFVKWNGGSKLPAPADKYCCDLFEWAKRRADGGLLTDDDAPDVPISLADVNPNAEPINPGYHAEESSKGPDIFRSASDAAYNLGTLPQRAFEASEAQRGGYGYDAGPILESATLPMGTGAVAGLPLRAGEVALGAGPIRAYHGSPHDFDAFDLSRIGTGEGAQAYGHGLYFADNEPTAKWYRDNLTDLKPRELEGHPDLTLPSWVAKRVESGNPQAFEDMRSDFSGRLSEMKRQLADPTTPQPWNIESNIPGIQNILTALDKHQSGVPLKPPGHMYEVNINADPEHFLDWDKPLNEQHPSIQDSVKKAMGVDYHGNYDPAKAERLWKEFGHSQARTAVRQGFIASDDKLVADRLRDAGIPGIKYLDQGSRAAGDGSRNYVVFDQNLINIMRKYGLAGLPAAGAAAKEMQDDEGHAEGGAVKNAIRKAVAMAKQAKRANGGKVHVGPIKSNHGGRTDTEEMAVPDGSYVLSADVVSHLGENNSAAGLKRAQEIFGERGHYDEAERRAAGGSAKSDGKPVDCITAGGEFVISPRVVKNIGGGDIEWGHKLLDRFSMNVRKDHIRTLASLPPPARD